ncbi:MAG: nucleotidyltransferase family protein [Parasphingorhabdus sp.]
MRHAQELRDLMVNDAFRCRVLSLVRSLKLDDCWIGAGFVRNAVWNNLHNNPSVHDGDIDVIWFDEKANKSTDREIEANLSELEPTIKWSVKNQARMHTRNSDAPYASTIDAMRYWPETATAIAVRLSNQCQCEIAAPFGLGDPYGLKVKPTPSFQKDKRHIFDDRVKKKNWLSIWPQLEVVDWR